MLDNGHTEIEARENNYYCSKRVVSIFCNKLLAIHDDCVMD